MSTGTDREIVPARQFRSGVQSFKSCVVQARLPMKDWIKQLRIELGRKEGRAKVTQSELAELVGLGLSAVGKWEMGKRPQKPERDSYVKLFHLASPQLRAKAPHDLTEVNGGEGHASEHPVDSAEGAGESGLMLSKLEHALIEN